MPRFSHHLRPIGHWYSGKPSWHIDFQTNRRHVLVRLPFQLCDSISAALASGGKKEQVLEEIVEQQGSESILVGFSQPSVELFILKDNLSPLSGLNWSHFWKWTFRVILRTGLWMPVAIHSEAGRGDSKWAKYRERDRTNCYNFGVIHSNSSLTTQKGATMFKIPELSLTLVIASGILSKYDCIHWTQWEGVLWCDI